MNQMSTSELKKIHEANKGDFLILDVREQKEWQTGIIPGSKLISLSNLPIKYNEISKEKTIFCICFSGYRSNQAAEYLESKGFQTASVVGGISNWNGQLTTP